MPPFVGRKRRSASPVPAPPPAKRVKTGAPSASRPPPALQKKISRFTVGSDDSDSTLSEVDSDEFEDVAGPSKPSSYHRLAHAGKQDDDEDEDIEWEDTPAHPVAPDFSKREFKDVKITVDKDEEPYFSARNTTKKGPSKREKQARMWAHQMHVQFLLWHNAKRNEWVNDKKVHDILLKQLPSQITKEIEKWRRASGLTVESQERLSKDKKKKIKKWKANGERNERDWGRPSQRLEEGKPDMSSGDPIISLLKVLAAYWKKRFAITAPGLRKRGYSTRAILRKDIESYRSDKHHPAKHGERIQSLQHFRNLAEKCGGSRDIGAQLFTALLRAIGIEARLVASLQPTGFGFTKAEEMVPRKIIDPESSEDSDVGSEPEASKKKGKAQSRKAGVKSAPIDLDTDVEDDTKMETDDESVVDVTPAMPKARPAKYDRDLLFPVYWAEAISPITSKVYPVSPLVLENAVATSAETLAAFEPKGAKADKTRQVMAYVVAYSSDYSAKDVTVRYLRKRLWPGKTKGFRVPIEKVQIHDKRGKVKRSEQYDWFKHVLSAYRRSDRKRTAVDDTEDATDLVPAEPEKKQLEGDTLQSLKASTEFVIEKHLRREEALIVGAEPDRYFNLGKGEKQEEIAVYKRSDVRRVMTAESWHKEGRVPRAGEAPMKYAPVRAVTLTRKREAEEHLIRTGEKQMQGLYSEEQTEYIIPPPIKDGHIPKNSYGNIDCFVPSMVPKGAVHLPLKGCVRLCKKLEIDFAEAVVGFEFGNKMAVPVIQGVVIAKENEKVVRDAWRTWNEEQRKKEETKMEKLVLETWRKMVIGLRIRDRVQEEYGLPSGRGDLQSGRVKDDPIQLNEEDHTTGVEPDQNDHEFGGGFLVDHEDDANQREELTLDFFAESDTDRRGLPNISASQDYYSPDYSQGYPTPVSPPRLSEKSASAPGPEPILYDSDEDDLGSTRTPRDTAGGFLQDDEESSAAVPASKPKKTAKRKSITVASNDNGGENGTTAPELKPRPRGRPRKTATQQEAPTSSVKKTRSTPARGAKSKITSMNVDGSADSENDDTQTGSRESHASHDSGYTDSGIEMFTKQSEAPASTTVIGGSTGRRGRRLLRKESTRVTSPYFDQQ
ncbi:hypothetical protein LTR05_008511 [Lithohypha guttulata]|uniref:DNA repair protein rhp42 n=1 Tax=Lithohypha guttulata TaxID=1690604 RepID=A0AAN7QAF3_9EURO|nr:hypothetical protein LTR05_008511 [Lithohypha guttulata]